MNINIDRFSYLAENTKYPYNLFWYRKKYHYKKNIFDKYIL